jgi:hypothetical protein
MTKAMKYLKSRTVLTLVFMIVLNGFQSIESTIPAETFVLVNAVLSALAVYFRVNPKVK